jgi:uncharacterized small protein (DUF1192 family)
MIDTDPLTARLRDEVARLKAENARLKADLDGTAEDVLAVLEGRDPDTWAWPLHGLRDAIDRLQARAERAEAERDAVIAWGRQHCPECGGDGLRIVGTFTSDEGVSEGEEGPCDCFAAIRLAAGLDPSPAGEEPPR